MEHNKQMILRTWKNYINGTALLHAGKRYRIITADWIVLRGWAFGDNSELEKPQNLKEADGTNLNIMKCPLFHIHHFFPLD